MAPAEPIAVAPPCEYVTRHQPAARHTEFGLPHTAEYALKNQSAVRQAVVDVMAGDVFMRVNQDQRIIDFNGLGILSARQAGGVLAQGIDIERM
jgi:hypothetical protein